MLRCLVLWLSLVGGVWAQASYTLPFRPLDAEYSVPLNRIVMISSSPNQLHIYDPATRSSVSVNLPMAPLDLSVSLDGQYAAVGHDGRITHVNLATASIVRVLTIDGVATTVVLGETHVFASGSGTAFSGQRVLSFPLNGGAPADNSFWAYSFGGARLAPNGQAIFSTRDGTSPNDLLKYVITNGAISASTDSPYHGDYSVCGRVWISADSQSVFNGCGTVFWNSSDPAIDLYYRTSFRGMNRLQSLWEIPARNELAAIPGPGPSPFIWNDQTPNVDTEVRLFQRGTLNPTGRLALADTVVGNRSHPTHGRWVFGSGQMLFVIAQADAAAGLAQDFSLRIFDLNSVNTCVPQLTTNGASVSGDGGIASITMSGTNCVHTVTANAAWLSILNEPLRSSNLPVRYLVRSNPGAARTATISVGGQSFEVSQAAATSPKPNPAPFPYRLMDAEFSKALNRVVILSAEPNELHLFDPVTLSDQTIPLRQAGLSVSVHPNGLQAAVGHDGWISIVDLQSRTVTREYELVTDVFDVVLAANGYAYAFPARSWSSIYSLRLSDGVVTSTQAIYTGSFARLQPNEPYIYRGAGESKWSIANGTAERVSSSFGSGCGGNVWFSTTGNRVITTCGDVRRTSPVLTEDMSYAGSLSRAAAVQWSDHSEAYQSSAVLAIKGFGSIPLTTDEIQIYGDELLGLAGRWALPTDAKGRFIFWNQTSSALYTIFTEGTEALSGSTAQSLVITPNASTAGCTPTINPVTETVGSGLGFGQFAVTAGAACAWTASSNVPWLRITAGRFGLGGGTVAYAVDASDTVVGRSGVITMSGGATLTVTQSPVPMSVTPVNVTISGAGGAQTAQVNTASPSTAWTAVPNVPWVSITSGASGTGTGTISYTVAANPGAARSGLIRVNSLNISILQQAATTPVNQPPSFVSTTLLSGAVREFVFSDANGADDFGVINILINRALDGRNACYLAYDAPSAQLYLVTGDGAGLLTLPAGPSATVENNVCRIIRAEFSAVKSGNTLTLRVRPWWIGPSYEPLAVYAAARDRSTGNSGWQGVAVMRDGVPFPLLRVEAVQPEQLSWPLSQAGFLRARYVPAVGGSQATMTTMQILVNTAVDGRGACYIGFDRAAGVLYLTSDDGSGLMTPGVPVNASLPTPVTIENSQCKLSSLGTTGGVDDTGSFVLNVNVQFKAGFRGNKFMYGGVQATGLMGGNSGWNLLQALKVE